MRIMTHKSRKAGISIIWLQRKGAKSWVNISSSTVLHSNLSNNAYLCAHETGLTVSVHNEHPSTSLVLYVSPSDSKTLACYTLASVPSIPHVYNFVHNHVYLPLVTCECPACKFWAWYYICCPPKCYIIAYFYCNLVDKIEGSDLLVSSLVHFHYQRAFHDV